ncbi:hypothetical protein GGI20_003408 [Coemansia sp. BCRC 34301]|nr:hypothetical protein GGI20_003408 [Coemansia sp. BCRC 34301]
MPNPLDIVVYQARKARLSEAEEQVIQRASARETRYKILGGVLGCSAGYLFTRRSPFKPLKIFTILFSGTLAYSASIAVASLVGLREMSNEKKYPHIVAAMRDLRLEILRSSGFDPSDPNAPPGMNTARRPINVKNLPPPMTEEDKAMHISGGMVFGSGAEYNGDHVQDDSMAQYSFGNPGLQQAMEDNPSAPKDGTDGPISSWDSIRKADGPLENAWNKLRKQSSLQQQPQLTRERLSDMARFPDKYSLQEFEQVIQALQSQPPTSRNQRVLLSKLIKEFSAEYQKKVWQQQRGSEGDQLANAWDRLSQQDNSEGSFSSGDAHWAPDAPALSSDEFPRSREDFEEATRHTTTKYGDTVYN